SDRDVRALQTAMFAALLTGLGLTRVPVVSNSLGGMTALWLALDAADLVSQVVILGVPATALCYGAGENSAMSTQSRSVRLCPYQPSARRGYQPAAVPQRRFAHWPIRWWNPRACSTATGEPPSPRARRASPTPSRTARLTAR